MTHQDLIGEMILYCCPSNWGDDDIAAKVWLRAEDQSGVRLPDSEHHHNIEARQRLGGTLQNSKKPAPE
jgi:hypothetical protein